ncbi:hypothetical protein K466DRAFT_589595 [Polyporus arcularius HHB13444]|uniref:Uncharacterized protein n=1 Tax=Polyporus arcularius HHB13444 TaxID=1314778 RepID=A0A5C3PCL4_9APHY|nr:hypothetical protein K466DRAFT_589595 [Polyporus arcularius HHB13444]
MTFHSFSVYVHLLICFAFTLLLQVPHAAGAPLNATIRLDSPLVSFTPGWRVATFGGTGQQFAFTNGQNEELRVTLPQNTTAVFYQGFKVAGGSLYFACIDCNSVTAQGPNTIAVDAHDDTENGTQPPETLFSFTNLDPTASHFLTVFNLADDRFNNTSQITFDSLVMTVGADDPGSISSTTTSATFTGIPTITVTAGHGPKQSASPVSTSAGQTDTVGVTVASTTTASPSSDSPSSGSQTTGAGTATSGTGASVTGTAIATQPPNTSQATQTQGAGATGTLGSSGTSGSPPTSATDSNGGNGSSGAASQPTSGSASNTSSAANGSGTSGSSNNGAAPSGGVSKTVIIVVAIVASLVVLSLLAVIVWLLLRSQPPPTDPEGSSGLMREAPTTAIISGPIALAPMRPPNPFADTVPANIPIDEVSPVDEIFAAPPLRPPPPIPPRSPLRTTFTRPRVPVPAWIERVPRTP